MSEYARYLGYWLRFTDEGVDVLCERKRYLLGSFRAAAKARKHVCKLRREKP